MGVRGLHRTASANYPAASAGSDAPLEERFTLFRGDLREELADPIFLPGYDVDHWIPGADQFVDFFEEGFRHDS